MSKGSESAFPVSVAIGDGPLGGEVWGGLTKREYFAAMAIRGAARSLFHESKDIKNMVVKTSVELADALIKALEAPHGE